MVALPGGRWVSAGLRFRVFVAGVLEVEDWVDAEHAGRETAVGLAFQHAAVALTSGKPWLVEVFDPDAPPDEAFIRFGSDAAGMVEPIVVEDLAEALRVVDPDEGG